MSTATRSIYRIVRRATYSISTTNGVITNLLPSLAHPWDREKTVQSNVPHLSLDRKPPIIDWNASCDILVRTKTGTEKTFEYLIPAIESRLKYVEHHASARIAYRHRCVGPLILVPTRELAIRIASDAQKLTTCQRDFEVQLLVGGAGKAGQMKEWMESSRDLVVATPGRLRDLLANEAEFRQGFNGCRMLILGEADVLLSMGFRDDIDAIISFLPKPPFRQTLLFSATTSRAVRQLASWVMSPDHAFLDAALPELDLITPRKEDHATHTKLSVPCDDEFTTHDHIEQFYTLCPTASDQIPTLLKLLAHDQLTHGSGSKVIVLCPTVETTKLFSMLLRSLAEEVLPSDATEILTMHPTMKQSARDRTLVLFHKAGGTQNGNPTVLVNSDIHARGVDYSGITRVIQIGIPSKETIYIHRMKRMARSVDSLVPGKGEDSESIARTDLLLLPWEAGYLDWQLTSVRIKPFSIATLDSRLGSLSPQSSTLTTKSLKSALAEIQHRVAPADVRNAAASLLGYYLLLTPSLRLQPSAVLTGVSFWASESFNVAIPTIIRFPRKFIEAYEQSTRSKETKGLFVDGLKVSGASLLSGAKSKNRSVWEGGNAWRKKPKRWH